MAKLLGEIIREQVKSSSLTNKEISERLNRTENTIYNLYTRSSVDTNTLKNLCRILNYDFFKHFYEDEPLKSLRADETEKFKEKITELQLELTRKDVIIKDLQLSTAIKTENISNLLEQLASLRKS